MKNETYTVYKHVNKTNGKVYIGITGNDVHVRWQYGNGYRRSPHFYSAIKKYGWNGFDHIIIRSGLSEEAACIAERKLIKHYDSRNPLHGYNVSSGGEAGGKPFHTEESREKIREAVTRAWSNPQLRLEQSLRFKGVPKSEQMKKKLGDSRRGEVRSEEQKALISATLKKYYSDPENRKKNSDSHVKYPVLCVETGRIYSSSHDAHRDTGLPQGNIYACCLGKRHSVGGLHWEFYIEEEKAAS